MAIDETLLRSSESGNWEVTLRLYGWSEPTLSLGYFQEPEEASGFDGLPMVRRITGGGAIVHDAELTYSLCWRLRPGSSCGTHPSPEKPPNMKPSPIPMSPSALPEGVETSYAAVNRALSTGLHLIGLEVATPDAATSPAHPGGKEFLCFRRRSRYDLVVDGYKVVGSAQRRRRRAVLQHGSILVGPSRHRRIPDPSLSELLGRKLSLEEVAEAVLTGFRRVFGWTFREGQLNDEERRLADQLSTNKYNRLDWGGRRRRNRGKTQPP